MIKKIKALNSYTEQMEELTLTFWQRIRLKLFNRTPIGKRRYPGWTGSLTFYLFKCEKHGYVIDYPHGYKGILYCSECMKNNLTVRD